MPKSKRAEAVEASAAPPAKRRKGDAKNSKTKSKTQSNGFKDILLNQKTTAANKKLPQAHTTKKAGKNSAKVQNEENVVVNAANGHGDVRESRNKKNEIVDISSDESSSLGESEDEEEKDEAVQVNGAVNGVEEMEEDAVAGAEQDKAEDAGDAMEDIEAEGDDSFGARLNAQTTEIDVEADLARQAEEEDSEASDSEAQTKVSKALTKPPTGATFVTILTQALRTNDQALLESCFSTHDLESVRESLSRIDSRLVVSLLHTIAERISKAPGRLGNLMVWIQWAVIAHGGYLATQKEIVFKLRALHQVIEHRAHGLAPLLQLKGKLDMLSAQVDLRRDESDRNARQAGNDEGEMTIYVEGEEDLEVDDEEASGDVDLNEVDEALLLNGVAGGESEDDEAMAVFGGGVQGDVSDSSAEEDGLIDDEASETSNEDSEEADESEEDDSE